MSVPFRFGRRQSIGAGVRLHATVHPFDPAVFCRSTARGAAPAAGVLEASPLSGFRLVSLDDGAVTGSMADRSPGAQAQ
jgi:hypothetical protein